MAEAPIHGIPEALDAADAAALSAARRELAALRMLLAEAVARAGGDNPSGGGGGGAGWAAAAAAVRSGGFVSRAEFVERTGEDIVLRMFSATATGLQAPVVGALDASLRRAVAGIPPHGAAPHAGAAAAAARVTTTATALELEATRRLVTTLLKLGADADGGTALSGPGGVGAPAYPPPYEWATPLEGAACGGAEAVLGALLEQGADVDGGMSEARPWSPLLAAVWARRAASARALARAGADTCGVEALAAACGNYDVVRVFEDPEVRFWNAAHRAGKAFGIGAYTRASDLYAVATRVADSAHLRVSNCV